MRAREDCFEVVCVLVFCGVEENEVEIFWGARDDVGGVAEDLGDVLG